MIEKRWMIGLTALALECALVPSARADSLNVTYVSEPSGAALLQNGQLMGYTPMTLRYDLTREDKNRGSKLLLGTSVKWASGASAEISSLTVDLRAVGKNAQFTFQRPDSFPGRENDVQVALEMQRLALARQQMRADQVLVLIENQRRYYEQAQLALQRSVVAPKVCTSSIIGSTIHTSCY